MAEICAHTVCRRRTSKAYWNEEKKTYENLCSVHAPKTITLTKASYETLTREREEAIARAENAERLHAELNRQHNELVQRAWSYEQESGVIGPSLLLSIVHAIQTCDEQAGKDGACECVRYIASILRRYQRGERLAKQRADRAEAQLAEARREVERLRSMLRSLQWSITRQEGNTYWAHCPRCLKRMDHGHADDCPLAAALNPLAEVEDEKHPQPNP